MVIDGQIKELRLIHQSLEAELGKLIRQGALPSGVMAEGEYDAPDLWGRLVALGRLVSELDGAGALNGLGGSTPQSDVDFVVAVRAAWGCFWELDKMLSGRSLGFAERQTVLRRLSDLMVGLSNGDYVDRVLGTVVAKLGE